MLYFWRLKKFDSIINLVSGRDSAPQKRRSNTSHPYALSAKHRKTTDGKSDSTSYPVFDMEPLHTISEGVSTPYIKFMKRLVGSNGVIEWRIHGNEVDVIVMNDIDLESFQKNKFSNIWRWKGSGPDPLYFCDCRMYSAMCRMKNQAAPTDQNTNCCHVRFCMEQVEPLYASLFAGNSFNPQTNIALKISSSLKNINVPVVRLGNDCHHHRFSVLSLDMLSCATVILNGNRFSCKDGKCRASKGHTRKVRHISDESQSCEHLLLLNNNTEQWIGLLADISDHRESDEDCLQDSFDIPHSIEMPLAQPDLSVSITHDVQSALLLMCIFGN